MIDQRAQTNIDRWLQEGYDSETKNTILRLAEENPEELIDAFYTNLSFGTGGLRGTMGVGTNRINLYTIRLATQGVANYLLKHGQGKEKPSVFIGFDCRHHSQDFAIETAKVLAANGIEVYLYTDLRPVANVSFGVRYLKCSAGIIITASHNPPDYNGYKVYWSHGGQVLPPHDHGITEEIELITTLDQVKTTDFPHPLIHEVSTEIDTAYCKAIHPCQMHPGDNLTHGGELKIVYTNLHGSGITMIPQVLSDWGFKHVHLVACQAKPDGSFPTVKSPNPEDSEALDCGIAELKSTHSDLLLATDPDTDRMGVVAMHEGNPFFFDGNQVSCILLEHLCRSLHQNQSMPCKPMCIKTIVTSELMRTIAEHHRVGCLDVLTGFKYVGETLQQWEEEGKSSAGHRFIFGAEESFGYLVGTHVRDKDAIVSAASICEAALQMKLQGKTLVDLLYEIYKTYGIYREKLLCLTCAGKEGCEKIASMMARLRHNPPQTIEDKRVTIFEDYQNRTAYHLESGHQELIVLPKSNVIRLWLNDGTKLAIRPSGTEPKIKLYCSVCDTRRHTDRTLQKAIATCDLRAATLLSHLKDTLLS